MNIIGIISEILSVLLKICYRLTDNYGVSIIIFTLLTKFVLFPVSIMIQKNSIKMVQMQPQIDALKIKYIDDKDKFTDEQLALYKKNHYHSSLGVIPLVIQLIFVFGLLDIIYKPLTFLLNFDKTTIDVIFQNIQSIAGFEITGKTAQIEAIHQIQLGRIAADASVSDAVNSVLQFSMNFLGMDLGSTPSVKNPDVLWIIPVLSGVSAWIMCVIQNRINVLQTTAGNLNKYGTMIFMIAFSVYFSFLVPAGVGLYWIFGNLFSIPSMYAVNAVIPPKKYVDFSYLKKVQEQKKIKEEKYRKYHKKEKADYKRFFSVKDMNLMIYSESNGFYKYYAGMIDYICEHSDIQIHYVTSDPEDNIFNDTREQIHSYYISQDKYLIPLFMKLDCDMCVMTTPDLEKYHIKRSRVRKDVEYVYTSHGLGSVALTLRKGALDWYDTVFCTGANEIEEIREIESIYNTRTKLLIEAGYTYIDDMIAKYSNEVSELFHERPQIMIAPSWQPDNLIELCADDILKHFLNKNYDVILRPHPQMVRNSPEVFDILKDKYKGTNIEIQTDFSVNSSVMEADVLITDWSDISYEYAFVTKKPVLFINTPMKVMNPEYDRLKTVPISIEIRDVIGKNINVDEICNIEDDVRELIDHKDDYRKQILCALDKYLFNVGKSSIIYGRYIIRRLK